MFRGTTQIAAFAALGFVAGAMSPAQAQTPTEIGQFSDWNAYKYESNGSANCYALTAPTTKSPANVDHGDNFFMVTRWVSKNVSEPLFQAGYQLNEAEGGDITIDGKSFSMFPKEDRAWIENAAEEPALISAMKAGSKMTVHVKSKRGTSTSYEFSLIGVTAALDAIDNCN